MKMNRITITSNLWSRVLCLLFLANLGYARLHPVIISPHQNTSDQNTYDLVPSSNNNPLCKFANDTDALICLSDKPVQLLESPCLGLVTSFSSLFGLILDVNGPAPGRRGFVITRPKEVVRMQNVTASTLAALDSHKLLSRASFSVEVEFTKLSSVIVYIYCNRTIIWSTGELSIDLSQSRRSEFLELLTWVEYNGGAQVLNVTMVDVISGYFTTAKPSTPLISIQFDLSQCLKHKYMYVGVAVESRSVDLALLESFPAPPVPTWTFNSDGPTPDLPRDIYGAPIFAFAAKTSHMIVAKVMIGVSVPGAVIFVGLICVIYVLHRRNSRLHALAKKYDLRGVEFHGGPQSFTHKALSTATKAFSSSQLIGKGGFGSVYKGKLHLRGARNHVNVAVKRISAASCQGVREFLNEVKIVGQVRHRNLVPLLGWCHEKGELLLVYEYMPNGSLDLHLFSITGEAHGNPVLTWARRLKILSGVGTALAYLHEEWEQRVIHRDIKSSNVMLDSDFNGRLGDFGLAKLSAHGQAPATTQILAGTYGYLAPELSQTLKATEKTDVYSFGALVLEVATGRSPCFPIAERINPEDVFLVDWVWSLHGIGNILDAADARLENAYDRAEMVALLKIGLLCCHPDPRKRPTMREVLNIWRGAVAFPDLPHTKPIPVFVASIPDFDNLNKIDDEDIVLANFEGDDVEFLKASQLPGAKLSPDWLRSRPGWKCTPLPI